MKTLSEVKRLSALVGLNKEEFILICGYKIPRVFIRNFIVYGLLTGGIGEALVYMNNRDGGIDSILAHLYIVLSVTCSAIIYLCLVRRNDKIIELFDYLETAVNQRCRFSQKSGAIYTKQTALIDKIAQICTWCFMCSIITEKMVPALSPICYYFFGFPSPEYWILILGIKDILPFEADSFIGFSIAFIVDVNVTSLFSLINLVFMSIYISITLMIGSCVEDIAASVVYSNENINKRIPIKENLFQIVHLHLHCYRMIEILEKIINAPIFWQLSSFAFQFAATLFHFQDTFSNLTPTVLININEFVFFLIINYILCYFITTLTNHCVVFGDTLYGLFWYDLPKREQYIILMIIHRSQQRYEIKGLDILPCSLDTFLKFLRNAISYYMVFRQLNAAL